MGFFRGVLRVLGFGTCLRAHGHWPLFPVHAPSWGFTPLAGYKCKPLRGPDEIRLLKIQPVRPGGACVPNSAHISRLCPKTFDRLIRVGPSFKPGVRDLQWLSLADYAQSALTLLYVRKRDKPTILWVDQMCIDQRNDIERGQQVQLMDEIYQHADSGIFWLGRADISDLGSILQRPWFRRSWVIQETVLARRIKLICGDDELDWDDFIRILQSVSCAPNLRTLINGETSPPLIIQHILAINTCRHKWKKGKHQSLVKLLFKFHQCDVMEIRDKVYSHMGMSDRLVQPDYTVPLSQALIQVAQNLLSNTMPTNYNHYTHDSYLRRQGMDLLYSAGIANQRMPLPSWVPDWNPGLRSRPLWQDGGSRYRAGGKVSRAVDFLPGNAISVSGKLFGTIMHVTEALDYKHAMRLHEAVGVWYQAARALLPSHLDRSVVAKSQKMMRYPAGFFTQWLLSSGYRPATRPDTERYYRAFEHLYKTRVMQWEGFRLHPEMMNVDWFHNIFAESHGRLSFITKRGYIGLANKGTETNDPVAVIKGGYVPVVLPKRQLGNDCEGTTWLGSRSPERKTETGSRTRIYRLVTECYVYGLMKGEISSMSDTQEQDFIIK
ncbi:heterokaryon incompatibility protein [Seiridium cupressi]